MERDTALARGAEFAAQIRKLQDEDVSRFLSRHIRRRDLHQVVANLNEAALSKDNQGSKSAQAALWKLGFTD